MKLAVFKDYGVGRYFAQLFDLSSLAISRAAFPHVDSFVLITDTYYDARKNGLIPKAALEKMEQGK